MKQNATPTKYEQAQARIDSMNFSDEEQEFIFADWGNADEHVDWLLTTTREEIQDWIEAGQ